MVFVIVYITKTNNKSSNIFDKFCMPYMKSKLTQMVKDNKSMTNTINKLKEIYTNL